MAERASARDRVIVMMLLYTGLRLAELVARRRRRADVGAQGIGHRAVGHVLRHTFLTAMPTRFLYAPT
jgi:integrase